MRVFLQYIVSLATPAIFYSHWQVVEKCDGVGWELEQISDISLLPNQVMKVVYSYFKSPPK